jgi:hypothetical protein
VVTGLSAAQPTGPPADRSAPTLTRDDVEAFAQTHALAYFRFGQDGPADVDAFECADGAAMRERMRKDRGQDLALSDDMVYCHAVLRGQFGFAGPATGAGSGDLLCPTGYLVLDGRTGAVVDQGPWGGTMQPYCVPRNTVP